MTPLLEAIRSHAKTGCESPAFDDGHVLLNWADTARLVENTVARLGLQVTGPVGLQLDHSTAGEILFLSLIEAGIPVVPLPPFFDEKQRNAALDNAGAKGSFVDCSLDGSVVQFDLKPHSSDPQICLRERLSSASAVVRPGTQGRLPVGRSSDRGRPTTFATFLAATLPAVTSRSCRSESCSSRLPGSSRRSSPAAPMLPLPGRAIGLANPLRPDPLALLRAITEQQIDVADPRSRISRRTGSRDGASGARLPDLDLVAVGGARISPEPLLERAAALGLPVRQGYGMTETGSVIALEDGRRLRMARSGRSIGAHRIPLAQDGEIIIEDRCSLAWSGNRDRPARSLPAISAVSTKKGNLSDRRAQVQPDRYQPRPQHFARMDRGPAGRGARNRASHGSRRWRARGSRR